MTRHRRTSRRRQRGFTLIELIVSMTAGLLISAAAFLLARNASSFFRHEARITAAQFNAVIGMSRVSVDLRRAAFLTVPSIEELRAGQNFCGNFGDYTAGMQLLAGVAIEEGGSVNAHPADHTLSIANGLEPDSLVLSGQFGSTEQFAVAAINGDVVTLQNDGAMRRTLLRATQGGEALADIFRVGRFLRIVDKEGRIGYGIIAAPPASVVGGFVQITTVASPALPTRERTGTCGCEGFCTGAIVNPVARMRYDLRAVDDTTYPRYRGLYQTSGIANVAYHRGVPGIPRTELIRVELDADDAEIDDTLEVLAEHVVDFKFGITAVDPNATGNAPTLVRSEIGEAAVYLTAAPLPAGRPQDIRSLQVRLSTRAAERDRDVQLATVVTPDGGLLRYQLDTTGGTTQGFARMRTLVTEVQLLNQM